MPYQQGIPPSPGTWHFLPSQTSDWPAGSSSQTPTAIQNLKPEENYYIKNINYILVHALDNRNKNKILTTNYDGNSFQTTELKLYAPSHRQDTTYHGLCYTSRGALAGMRNSLMGPPHEGSIGRPIGPRANALTTELHLAPC